MAKKDKLLFHPSAAGSISQVPAYEITYNNLSRNAHYNRIFLAEIRLVMLRFANMHLRDQGAVQEALLGALQGNRK